MIIKNYEIKKSLSSFLEKKIFLIYGENYGLKKDIKKIIFSKLEKKDPEYLSLSEEEIIKNEEAFYNFVNLKSLFNNQKILVVNNVTDKITKYVKYIDDTKLEDILIIFFAEILEKKSKLRNLFEASKKNICIPCYYDTEKDLEIIALKELSDDKINLSREIINFLVKQANGDRSNLRNELDKIKSFSKGKKDSDFTQIKKLINFSGEIKVDNLVNICLCGDKINVNNLLSELYTKSISEIFLLKVLSNKIRKLIEIKKMSEDKQNLDFLINNYKPPIFWKEKPIIKKQLIIWNLFDLKKIIYQISDIETDCKRNPEISKIIFLKFFNEICIKANNYA